MFSLKDALQSVVVCLFVSSMCMVSAAEPNAKEAVPTPAPVISPERSVHVTQVIFALIKKIEPLYSALFVPQAVKQITADEELKAQILSWSIKQEKKKGLITRVNKLFHHPAWAEETDRIDLGGSDFACRIWPVLHKSLVDAGISEIVVREINYETMYEAKPAAGIKEVQTDDGEYSLGYVDIDGRLGVLLSNYRGWITEKKPQLDLLRIAHMERSSIHFVEKDSQTPAVIAPLPAGTVELVLSDWWIKELDQGLLPAAKQTLLTALRSAAANGDHAMAKAYGMSGLTFVKGEVKDTDDFVTVMKSFRASVATGSVGQVKRTSVGLHRLIDAASKKSGSVLDTSTASAFTASWISASYFMDWGEFQRIHLNDGWVVSWMEERDTKGTFRSSGISYYKDKDTQTVLNDNLRLQASVLGSVAVSTQKGATIAEVEAFTGLGSWGGEKYRWGVRAGANLAVETPTKADEREAFVAGQLFFPDAGVANLQFHPQIRAPLGERSTFPASRSRNLLNSYQSASVGEEGMIFISYGIGAKLIQATVTPNSTNEEEVAYHPMGFGMFKFGFDGGFSGVDADQVVAKPGWFSVDVFVHAGGTGRNWVREFTGGEWNRADFISGGGELSFKVFNKMSLIFKGAIPFASKLRESLGETYSLGIGIDTTR